MSRWAVVLAGGVGSRFWPLSTPARPKQLLPLVTDVPLLAETLARLAPLVPAERTLVITNATLAPAVAKLLPSLPSENIIAEPRSAGTAPALTWAALEVSRRDGVGAVMMCVHADWAIGDADGFRAALGAAATVAENSGSLVTVGVVPTRPDPGFGYIRPAEEARGGARRVAQFIEKPDRATAETLVREGCLWNSGIFVWGAGDFLTEVRLHCPEVTKALIHSDPDAIATFFAECTPISVDHGVLERSRECSCCAAISGGTMWARGRRCIACARKDASGNATAGDVHVLEARENVIHAEGHTVVAYGVEGLVVVARDGLTLVTTRERAADLKKLVDALPPEVRERS